MNSLVKNHSIKYGLIIAAISILYYTVAYLFDETLFANFWLGMLILLANFTLILVAVFTFKSSQDGFISFKEAFSVVVLTWLVSVVLSIGFNLIIFHVVEPELGDRITEMTINKSVEMMEKFNTPEEQIEESVKKLQEANQYSVANIFKGGLYSLLFMAVVGLIIAAFVKKPKPIFEETSSED